MTATRTASGLALLLGVAAGLARPDDTDTGAARANQALGRGVNFGNVLEAPREGAWGLRLEPEYFEAIKKAGFHSVRLPVKWSAHAAEEPPYALDETFARRVDWALDQAQA